MVWIVVAAIAGAIVGVVATNAVLIVHLAKSWRADETKSGSD